jgi:hypothetical protein
MESQDTKKPSQKPLLQWFPAQSLAVKPRDIGCPSFGKDCHSFTTSMEGKPCQHDRSNTLKISKISSWQSPHQHHDHYSHKSHQSNRFQLLKQLCLQPSRGKGHSLSTGIPTTWARASVSLRSLGPSLGKSRLGKVGTIHISDFTGQKRFHPPTSTVDLQIDPASEHDWTWDIIQNHIKSPKPNFSHNLAGGSFSSFTATWLALSSKQQIGDGVRHQVPAHGQDPLRLDDVDGLVQLAPQLFCWWTQTRKPIDDFLVLQ